MEQQNLIYQADRDASLIEKYGFFEDLKFSKLFKMSFLKIFSIVSLLSLSFIMPGQDVIVIVTDYTPEIKDSKKITFKPTMIDTDYVAPTFNYSIVTRRIDVPFSPRPIGAAKTTGDKLDPIYRGYIAGGFGNYATPMLEGIYSFGRSKTQIGSVHFRHLSSAGKIKDYIFPGLSENIFRTNYIQLFDKNRVNVAAGYSRNMFHYYGVNVLDTVLTNGEDLTDEANKHLFNRAFVNLSFGRFDLKKVKTNFDLHLGYYFLIDNYASRENGLNFNAFIDRKINLINTLELQKIGISTNFKFYNNSDSLHIDNSWALDLNPYYEFSYRKLDGRLGIKSVVVEDTATDLYFYPDIMFNIDIVDKVLNLEFLLNGGVERNSFDKVSSENPFINSLLPLAFSRNVLTSSLRMYSNLSRYIDFQLGLEYQKWANGAFFIADTSINLLNKFTIVYDDFDMIKLKAAASFHLNERLDLIADLDYYVYNMEVFSHAWHRPDFEIGFLGVYRIADKLRFNVDLTYMGKSYSPTNELGVPIVTQINPWVDFSLGAEYRYKKRFGFFVNFNNITSSRYQRWYNYPSYGFNFMAGANYCF